MRIVVTGGAGALGRLVSTEAESRGHDVRAISRRTGVDLSTGAGVAEELLANSGRSVTVVRATQFHDGRPPPRVVTLPAIGGVLKSFARQTNLPGPEAEIVGRTFDEWLSAP